MGEGEVESEYAGPGHPPPRRGWWRESPEIAVSGDSLAYGIVTAVGSRKDRVVYVRVTATEHERLATFAADRNIHMAEAARAILAERLERPLLRPTAPQRSTARR